MRTPAEKHARNLIKQHGPLGAREIVKRKIQDAPFMVNGDRAFWIAVKEALK